MNKIRNKGWSVAMAWLGINLALGILNTWSIFKQSNKESILTGDGRFNWDIASLNDPFAVCCLMVTVAMVFAGRLQDKLSLGRRRLCLSPGVADDRGPNRLTGGSLHYVCGSIDGQFCDGT